MGISDLLDKQDYSVILIIIRIEMLYRPAIVGMLDLLGFSADLMSVELDPPHLLGRKLMFDGLKLMSAEIVSEKVKSKASIKWASDTCVVCYPLKESDLSKLSKEELFAETTEGLIHVSKALGAIQCCFASSEFFSRGSIAFGMQVESGESEPFGTGLVRANDIVKNISDDPVISVSGMLSAQALSIKVNWNGRRMYMLSFPLPFIDYLSFAEVVDYFGMARIILAAHADHVHRFVESAYSDKTLVTKAAFLLTYHNWHIKSRGNLDNLLVKLQPPDQ